MPGEPSAQQLQKEERSQVISSVVESFKKIFLEENVHELDCYLSSIIIIFQLIVWGSKNPKMGHKGGEVCGVAELQSVPCAQHQSCYRRSI